LGWQIPSTAQPATDATACVTGFCCLRGRDPDTVCDPRSESQPQTIYCIGDGNRGLGWVKAAEQTVAPAQQL
jgi:hypothetical protein